jgi:hypothetical protein
MLCEVVEERHSLRFLKAGAPGLNRVNNVLQAASIPTAADREHCPPCRTWGTGLERFTQGRQRKTLGVALGEKPKTRQRPHQSVQGRRVNRHRA